MPLNNLASLDALRLRPTGSYEGTITEPGPLVSDGKILFMLDAVRSSCAALAHRLSGRSATDGRAAIRQNDAAKVFDRLARRASRRAHILGQTELPSWAPASDVDRIAVLCYGRGRQKQHVFVNAHRLLLLNHLLAADEVRCTSPDDPVVLRRRGQAVGVLTVVRLHAASAP